MNQIFLETIRHLVPDCQLSWVGKIETKDDYENNVAWDDERQQPTWEEIEAAKSLIEAQFATQALAVSRHSAYVAEADPLFFGWQRGENSEQAWLDKVAEIRARYPYPA